jgi:tRNA threonylcarbamoyladenosine biosynthesis protein TsaB
MLLALDTSGAVSVAVLDDTAETVLAHRHDAATRRHAEVLVPFIDECLTEAGGARRDLTAVVVGRGPGPFTGLRVGLVTARTLAFALGIEALGVSGLDALAGRAAAAHPEARTLGVATDARRKEVYWATYRAADGRPVRTAGPAVDRPAVAAETLAATDVVVGRGTVLYAEALGTAPAADDLLDVDAAWLARVAVAARAAGEDLSSTEPLYLRGADAKVPSAPKSALGS